MLGHRDPRQRKLSKELFLESNQQSRNSLAVKTPEVLFYDENKMVGSRGVGSQPDSECQRQKTKTNKKSKPKQVEMFTCTVAGCLRGFVNQAELSIHIDVMHSNGENLESVPVADFDPESIPFYTTQTKDIAGDLFDEGYGTKTIRPTPITEASLRALDESTSSDITRSMEDLSISDAHRSSVSVVSFDTTYSVMDGLEDAPISEVAEQDSPRIQLPVRILLCLWIKLLTDISRRFSSGTRQHAVYPEPSGQYAPASQSKENLGTSSVASSQTSGTRSFKRRRSSDDGEDDNDRKNPKMRMKSGQATPENRPLACPFNKYDNYTFGGDARNTAYHVCSTWNDVKTAYFKQHLIRNHCIPEYHCDRCGGDFKNQTNLREHRRMDPPCQVKDLDNQKIMPEVQVELGLRTRNVVGMDRITYWHKVYDTIFGSEARKTRPVEPYYEGPSHEILQRFIHFSELRMPEVIRRSREMLHVSPEDYHERDTQLVRTILQEASQAFMLEARQSNPPSLREIKQQNSPGASAVDAGENTIIAKETKRQVGQVLPAENNRRQEFTQPLAPAVSPQPQMPKRTMRLPTRPADDVPPATQSFGFPHAPEYSEASWATQDFEHFPYLNMPEFDATIEDPDMYGPGTMIQNDLEGFDFVENPADTSRRERRIP